MASNGSNDNERNLIPVDGNNADKNTAVRKEEGMEATADVTLLQPRNTSHPMAEPVAGVRRADSVTDAAPAESKPAKTQSPGVNRPPWVGDSNSAM